MYPYHTYNANRKLADVAPTPESTSRWYQTLLPIATAGGPILTLALALMLVVTVWWLVGNLRDCVDRNRLLGERLVTQQETFHRELLVHLQRCQPHP